MILWKCPNLCNQPPGEPGPGQCRTCGEALTPDHRDLTARMLDLLAREKPLLRNAPGWREWVADAREALDVEGER